MKDDPISVIEAAKSLGMRKQTLFKAICRLGVTTFKQKSSSHRGQRISYISKADFDRIVDEQLTTQDTTNDGKVISVAQVDHGVFYLIQLEPVLDPGRFKLGFASNMAERLRSHRCSAPLAVVLETWPCHQLWEKTAIDCVTHGSERLHTEVFRAEDVGAVKVKCDQFFSLMPALDSIMR